MDNLYLRRLPGTTVPTVTGADAIIAETGDGKLMWADSGGAKRIMTVDERYEVGDHAIQFFGERTPAEKYGGTWEIDSEYEGRVIIGSGGSYTFGAKGGEEKHTQTINEMPDHMHSLVVNADDPNSSGVIADHIVLGYSTKWKIFQGNLVQPEGDTQPFNIMQPYCVVNAWKKIAN